jgi:hypothetical protein
MEANIMAEKSKLELFEEAKRLRQKEREEKEKRDANRGNNNYQNFEPINYVAMEIGEDHIVRFLGNPMLQRNNDPYSPKLVLSSKIIGDDDKQFRCIWPQQSQQPNWILWKIYNTVMKYKWDQALNGGKGGRVYDYATVHPTIFGRIAKNGKLDNTFEDGWTPNKFIMINVIDRHDMEFHKTNKQTKLLSKKVSISKDEKTAFYEIGITEKLYNSVWDGIVEKCGPWEDYDICVRKEKADPWYIAYHAEKEDWKINDSVKKFIVKGPLTEEELSWERYNIDNLSKVSSYQKIQKKLGLFIEQVDQVFEKKYTEELNDLVELEKQEYEKNKKEKEEKTIVQKPEINKKKEEVKKEIPSRNSIKKEEVFSVDSLDKAYYKGIDKLTNEMKKQIIGKTENGGLKYTENSPQPYICVSKDCDFAAPANFTYCPKCGVELPEPPK